LHQRFFENPSEQLDAGKQNNERFTPKEGWSNDGSGFIRRDMEEINRRFHAAISAGAELHFEEPATAIGRRFARLVRAGRLLLLFLRAARLTILVAWLSQPSFMLSSIIYAAPNHLIALARGEPRQRKWLTLIKTSS
jgi:hypothetical protein